MAGNRWARVSGCLLAATGVVLAGAPAASAGIPPVEAVAAYATAGSPVTGADVLSEEAPLLEPGQYLDSFAAGGTDNSSEPQGTRKYYTIPVIEGSRFYVSATVVPPANTVAVDSSTIGSLGISAKLRAKDNYECVSDSESEVMSSGVLPAIVTLSSEVGGVLWPTRCPMYGVLILEVQRTGDAYADEELAVEIVVRTEPPVDTTGMPEPAEQGETLAMVAHGDSPTSIAAGNSFNDAPVLTSGVTFTDSLRTGEGSYFEIPLEWGQRFSYTISEAGPPTPTLDISASVSVDVFNPVRDPVEMTQGTTSSKSWFAGQDNDPFTGSTVYPVRYTNRDGSVQDKSSLDGTYYLRLSADLDEEASSTPYLITVVVVGEPEPGPAYLPLGVVLSTTSSSGVTEVLTSTASGFAEPPSAEVPPGATTDATLLAESDQQASVDPNWLIVGGAGVAVLVGIGVLFALARGRRRPSH